MGCFWLKNQAPAMTGLTYFLCAQLNDTTTVLIGGSIDPTSIVTFSWITLTFTLQPATLKKIRRLSTCGTLKLTSGEERQFA